MTDKKLPPVVSAASGKPAGSLKAMAEGKVFGIQKALLAAHAQCVVADEDDEL